jgi:hypothetical protein
MTACILGLEDGVVALIIFDAQAILAAYSFCLASSVFRLISAFCLSRAWRRCSYPEYGDGGAARAFCGRCVVGKKASNHRHSISTNGMDRSFSLIEERLGP